MAIVLYRDPQSEFRLARTFVSGRLMGVAVRPHLFRKELLLR
jgi:hypothetical protein